jgi:hypothetical protein
MGGSTTNFGNISLQGMLLRITGAAPLPAGLMWGLRIAQWATLLAVLALLARRPVADWQRGPSAPAAAAALLAWLLIFSPLFWEHYHIYLAPLWGWLVWEAAQTRWRMALVIIALALAWTPLPVIGALRPLPEPVNSGMLFSAMLILGIAIDRLRRPAAPAAPQASASM